MQNKLSGCQSLVLWFARFIVTDRCPIAAPSLIIHPEFGLDDFSYDGWPTMPLTRRPYSSVGGIVIAPCRFPKER